MLLLRRPTILASLPALTSSFLSITTAGKLVLPRPITTLPKHSFHTCQQTPLKMADTISTPSSSAESRERELLGFFKNISTFMPPAVLLENSRRVTEKLAAQMLDQIDLNKDTTTPFKLFDNACGIGATNFELYRRVQREVLKESKVLCGDFSEGAIDIAKKVAEVEGWTGETEVRVVDAQVCSPTPNPLFANKKSKHLIWQYSTTNRLLLVSIEHWSPLGTFHPRYDESRVPRCTGFQGCS